MGRLLTMTAYLNKKAIFDRWGKCFTFSAFFVSLQLLLSSCTGGGSDTKSGRISDKDDNSQVLLASSAQSVEGYNQGSSVSGKVRNVEGQYEQNGFGLHGVASISSSGLNLTGDLTATREVVVKELILVTNQGAKYEDIGRIPVDEQGNFQGQIPWGKNIFFLIEEEGVEKTAFVSSSNNNDLIKIEINDKSTLTSNIVNKMMSQPQGQEFIKNGLIDDQSIYTAAADILDVLSNYIVSYGVEDLSDVDMIDTFIDGVSKELLNLKISQADANALQGITSDELARQYEAQAKSLGIKLSKDDIETLFKKLPFNKVLETRTEEQVKQLNAITSNDLAPTVDSGFIVPDSNLTEVNSQETSSQLVKKVDDIEPDDRGLSICDVVTGEGCITVEQKDIKFETSASFELTGEQVSPGSTTLSSESLMLEESKSSLDDNLIAEAQDSQNETNILEQSREEQTEESQEKLELVADGSDTNTFSDQELIAVSTESSQNEQQAQSELISLEQDTSADSSSKSLSESREVQILAPATDGSQEQAQRLEDNLALAQNELTESTTENIEQVVEKVEELVEEKPAMVYQPGCLIYQDECKSNSNKTGYFWDSNKQAKVDEKRCMQRAYEFQKSCQNSQSIVTTAQFFDSDAQLIRETRTSSACEIVLDHCESRPNKVGIFLDYAKNAHIDEKACMQRATDYHRWCKNAVDDNVVASFYVEGSKIASKQSKHGCVIEQNVCRNKPSYAGAFFDGHKEASQDPIRCMQRVFDYQKWCRNGFNEVTTAKFYDNNGTLISQKDTKMDTACVIEQANCNKYPDRIGEFLDYNKGSFKDQTRCLARAVEFHKWCENSVDDITVATFYKDGNAVAKEDTTSGCIIEQEYCRAHPEKNGSFFDYHKGADKDEQKCAARSQQYHQWCENKFEEVVVAKFLQKGQIVMQKDTRSGCVITQETCKRDGKKTGSYMDYYRDAGQDQVACVARAKQIHSWCKNDFDQVVQAVFYKDGEVMAASDSKSGCAIQMDVCRKNPDRVGFFLDTNKNASVDENICLRRSVDYHRWCGNSFEDVVKASYYDEGKKVSESSSQEGCYIEQNVCKAHPDFVGNFLDNNKAAHIDEAACMNRAKAMHRWCMNPYDETTTARFYRDAVKVAEKNTKDSACIIKQDTCSKHKTWIGEFSDYAKGSDTSAEVCLDRAKDYHRWCGNSPDVRTSASFMSHGSVYEHSEYPLRD